MRRRREAIRNLMMLWPIGMMEAVTIRRHFGIRPVIGLGGRMGRWKKRGDLRGFIKDGTKADPG